MIIATPLHAVGADCKPVHSSWVTDEAQARKAQMLLSAVSDSTMRFAQQVEFARSVFDDRRNI